VTPITAALFFITYVTLVYLLSKTNELSKKLDEELEE